MTETPEQKLDTLMEDRKARERYVNALESDLKLSAIKLARLEELQSELIRLVNGHGISYNGVGSVKKITDAAYKRIDDLRAENATLEKQLFNIAARLASEYERGYDDGEAAANLDLDLGEQS